MDVKNSALCAGAGALAMYLLLKSSSGKKETAPAALAPAKKQTDSISVVCIKEHTTIFDLGNATCLNMEDTQYEPT